MTIPEAEHRPTAVALAIMAVASRGGLKRRKTLLAPRTGNLSADSSSANRKGRRRGTTGKKEKKEKRNWSVSSIDLERHLEDGGQIGASRYFFLGILPSFLPFFPRFRLPFSRSSRKEREVEGYYIVESDKSSSLKTFLNIIRDLS